MFKNGWTLLAAAGLVCARDHGLGPGVGDERGKSDLTTRHPCSARSVHAILSLCGVLLALSAPAHAAGDGTPFLMKVGTGGGTLLPPANADSPYTNMMSVSITPKRSGICTVTGAFRVPPESNAALQIVLSRAPDTAGTGAQVYDNPGRSISGAISDPFVVQKNVPVSFVMNGRNLGTTNLHSENKHLWVICAQERTPTLP